jgi:hypothetical protein
MSGLLSGEQERSAMDQAADTAWCPVGCCLLLSNSIAAMAFQEIFTTPAEIIVLMKEDDT